MGKTLKIHKGSAVRLPMLDLRRFAPQLMPGVSRLYLETQSVSFIEEESKQGESLTPICVW